MTVSPKDRMIEPRYALYASLPGWTKNAMEQARANGGYRSKREWLEHYLTRRLARYRNGAP